MCQNKQYWLISISATLSFIFFGSFFIPCGQEQIVIKARYESASASALLLKMKVMLFVEERMSSLSLYMLTFHAKFK
jgi:hypothetical protein